MQPLTRKRAERDMIKYIISNEYNTILLIKQETNILIPNVHAVELDPESPVKAQFMLIDCLRGNICIDLGIEIPNYRKSYVFSKMAEIQVSNCFIHRIWYSIAKFPLLRFGCREYSY